MKGRLALERLVLLCLAAGRDPVLLELRAHDRPHLRLNYKDGAGRAQWSKSRDPYTMIGGRGRAGRIDWSLRRAGDLRIDRDGVIRSSIGPGPPEALKNRIIPLVKELQK